MKKKIMPATGAKTQKGRHMRPENKDDLDSRKNEEQDFKGDDSTHNRKDKKNQKAYQKKKDH